MGIHTHTPLHQISHHEADLSEVATSFQQAAADRELGMVKDQEHVVEVPWGMGYRD